MCDERERLIGFVYDEVEPAERRAIEAHLAECPDCRQEVAGLRQARQDLLAWDVPVHEPIWRPMPPARPPVSWRQVPAWAMAAAATVVMAAGLGGAMASRWFVPAAPLTTSAERPAPAPAPVAVAAPSPGVTAAEVAALEARLLARLRDEMQVQLRTVADRQGAGASTNATRVAQPGGGSDGVIGRLAEVEHRLDEHDEWRRKQIEANWSVNNRLASINSQARSLGDDWEYTRAMIQRVNLTSGPSIGR